MLKEIQTARLSEERKGGQREGPMVAKDLVWAMVVLTCGRKRTCLWNLIKRHCKSNGRHEFEQQTVPTISQALESPTCISWAVIENQPSVSTRDVPGTNFLPGTEYQVLRRFFTGSGYRVPGI